jgi:hypothetical protein
MKTANVHERSRSRNSGNSAVSAHTLCLLAQHAADFSNIARGRSLSPAFERGPNVAKNLRGTIERARTPVPSCFSDQKVDPRMSYLPVAETPPESLGRGSLYAMRPRSWHFVSIAALARLAEQFNGLIQSYVASPA